MNTPTTLMTTPAGTPGPAGVTGVHEHTTRCGDTPTRENPPTPVHPTPDTHPRAQADTHSVSTTLFFSTGRTADPSRSHLPEHTRTHAITDPQESRAWGLRAGGFGAASAPRARAHGRSERALGQAIRKGQDAGEIAGRYVGGGVAVPGVRGSVSRSSFDEVDDRVQKTSPTEFFNRNGQAAHETYQMTDHVSDSEFEDAIADARAEGNLSRANVAQPVGRLCTRRAPGVTMPVFARLSGPVVDTESDARPVQGAVVSLETDDETTTHDVGSTARGARMAAQARRATPASPRARRTAAASRPLEVGRVDTPALSSELTLPARDTRTRTSASRRSPETRGGGALETGRGRRARPEKYRVIFRFWGLMGVCGA